MSIKTNTFIRIIINIFRPSKPTGIVPINDMIEVDKNGSYASLGGDPYCILHGGKPGRYMHLEITGRSDERRNVTLYVASRGELSAKDAVHVGTLLPDSRVISLDIRVPMSTRMLRLDFGNRPGNFYIEELKINHPTIFKEIVRLFGRAKQVLKEGGIAEVFHRIPRVISRMRVKNLSTQDYTQWLEWYNPSESELKRQKQSYKKLDGPLVSIIVPTYNTDETMLRDMIESVAQQTYQNWELCIADGGSDGLIVAKVLDEYQIKLGSKLKFVLLGENRGIAGNTNAGLALATGDFVSMLDHDDILPSWALYEVCLAISKNDKADMIYTDEDKISPDLTRRFEPHFKPDFNLYLLRSMNYITHFLTVRKSLMDELGGFRGEFDGAQDYDLILRAGEMARDIVHVPKVCYHWRSHMLSTALDVDTKPYVIDATKKAINQHLKRSGIAGDVEMYKAHTMTAYRVKYIMDTIPKVSIIIPNKDHTDDLDICLDSIAKYTTYENYEVIVVENNSEDEQTFEYYDKKQEEFPFKLLKYKGGFNFSAINNFAVDASDGEYVLLLNNDTEAIHEGWLYEMMSLCIQPDVSAVGAKLYYPDDTIQHAGCIVGFMGVADHSFKGVPRNNPGYFGRASAIQELTAVTAACMLIEKEDYIKVGKLDEEYAVAFNDTDMCMKLTGTGKKLIYTPFSELYHHESKSRGLEDTPQKRKRFQNEALRFMNKYRDRLEDGDPYYNPNLSLVIFPFALRGRNE